MPKPFPILINVEEIALGTVLRKLHEMPGVVSVDLQLGHGGEGAGKKQLEQHAAANGNGSNGEQSVLKVLADGRDWPAREVAAALGWKKPRAYGALHQLRKKGLVQAGSDKGTHRITRLAAAHLNGVRALPAPSAPSAHPQVKKGPSGERSSPGSGNIVLKSILSDGPKAPNEIRTLAADHGMSPKSLSGILLRAKNAGLIKKNGSGYELTAKGQKIETGAAAHG
jgi:Mn-dependent DtxR family transcriptional regulator